MNIDEDYFVNLKNEVVELLQLAPIIQLRTIKKELIALKNALINDKDIEPDADVDCENIPKSHHVMTLDLLTNILKTSSNVTFSGPVMINHVTGNGNVFEQQNTCRK